MTVSPAGSKAREKPISPEKILRQLFLTLFLRGRSSRGLTKRTAPQSVPQKLWLTLLGYGLPGVFVLFLTGQKVLTISITMHGMTFLMLGMFVATSAGETLFNKEEAEILMHRPVTSQMILRAKAFVLVQISLYLAFALNAAGMIAGALASDGSWLFPFVHAISTVEEALFSTGLVVLLYQICLKWLGRERIEGIMTTLQVVLIATMTVGTQLIPRLAFRHGLDTVDLDIPWLKAMPPSWFAALDDVLAGSGSADSGMVALLGLVVTGTVVYFAFGKLASVYESGWQTLNESAPARSSQKSQFRLIKTLSEAPPLCWFLKGPITKASFQLICAYMFRDRDIKLRLYPGLAPTLVMPLALFVAQSGMPNPRHSHISTGWFSGFMVAMASAYLCLVPVTALNLLKFSQQWRASEVFVIAPITGPQPLLQGARVAVLFFLALPLAVSLALFTAFTQGGAAVWQILSGIIALPVYAMIPGVLVNSTPLSNPPEEAQSASGCLMLAIQMAGAMTIAGLATAASAFGFLWIFLLGEATFAAAACYGLYRLQARTTWRSYD